MLFDIIVSEHLLYWKKKENRPLWFLYEKTPWFVSSSFFLKIKQGIGGNIIKENVRTIH